MPYVEKNEEKYRKHQFDFVDFQTKFLSNIFDLMSEWGTDFKLPNATDLQPRTKVQTTA